MTERVDGEFLEKLIIKSAEKDKQFLLLISSVFEPEYFDDPSASELFKVYRDYFQEYNQTPPRDIVGNLVGVDSIDKVKSFYEEIDSIDFDNASNYQFLFDSTNEYLKEQALKKAIVDSVDIIESGGNKNLIRENIEGALVKDLKIDMGLWYFSSLGERLRKIFTESVNRIPTFFRQFDEYINGGFPPYTLSVLVARIHGFKSNTLANFAARQVLNGYNPVLFTMEMSELAFAQRFDSILTLLDINRIYMIEDYKRKLASKLRQIKQTENRGELYIKEYPTGGATIANFRSFLHELRMRDIEFHIIYADYINLMKSETYGAADLYSKVKAVSEELRALSLEFNVPVVSVSQLNREGTFVGFEELDYNYIAESLGLPATADFMGIYGIDEDSIVYNNEVFYKIAKNRLGGRVGETDKFYYDRRSLKMYDATELDLWMSEASESGDEREPYERQEEQQRPQRRRRR